MSLDTYHSGQLSSGLDRPSSAAYHAGPWPMVVGWEFINDYVQHCAACPRVNKPFGPFPIMYHPMSWNWAPL